MGILNGGIQSLFGSVFGGFYLDAQLIRILKTDDGEGGGTAEPVYSACKVQQDQVTEEMRASGGYTERDLRFIILQSGVNFLDSDCRLEFEGQEYNLSDPQQDPARSYWAVRATPFTGNTDG